jgi:hypothetical protein
MPGCRANAPAGRLPGSALPTADLAGPARAADSTRVGGGSACASGRWLASTATNGHPRKTTLRY